MDRFDGKGQGALRLCGQRIARLDGEAPRMGDRSHWYTLLLAGPFRCSLSCLVRAGRFQEAQAHALQAESTRVVEFCSALQPAAAPQIAGRFSVSVPDVRRRRELGPEA